MDHGRSLWGRFAQFVGAVLLLAGAVTAAHAQISGDCYQLFSEVNGTLKNFQTNRPPDCTVDLIDKVQNAIQGALFRTAADEIIVKSLETAAKVGLGALGIPGYLISGYSATRCFMNESSAQGLKQCLTGEVLGFAGGEGMSASGIGSVRGALAGAAWDKVYGDMRNAYNGAPKTERMEGTFESGGQCTGRFTVIWDKQRRPNANGGVITVFATVNECECQTAREVRSGHLRARFRVVVPRHGSEPIWRLQSADQYHVEAQCCGSSARNRSRVYLFDANGKYIAQAPEPGDTPPPPRPQTGGASPPATGISAGGSPGETAAPQPAKPPPIYLPPPERIEYTRANPCPACVPIQQRVEEVAREIAELRSQRTAKEGEKKATEEEQARLERRAANLEARLRGESGVGASSTDKATGITTEAIDTGDGRVRIRTTDASGRVLSERFRERESTADIQASLAQTRADRQKTSADIARIQSEIEALERKRTEAIRRYDNLQQSLDECVRTLCGAYATCEQLKKHIDSYRNAGPQVAARSQGVINELVRRAREMGCFDIDSAQAELVGKTFDLTGNAAPGSPVPGATPSGGPAPAVSPPGAQAVPLPAARPVTTDCTACRTIAERLTQAVQSRHTVAEALGGQRAQLSEFERQIEEFQVAVQYLESYPAPNRAIYIDEILRAPGLPTAVLDYYRRTRDDSTATQATGSFRRSIEALQRQSNALAASIEAATHELGELDRRIEALVRELNACERGCVSVLIRDVVPVTGVNPFNRLDPAGNTQGSGGTATSTVGGTQTSSSTTPAAAVVTIPVLSVAGRNVPTRLLNLAGAEAGCPAGGGLTGAHYHALSATACDGTVLADPSPGGCGFGRRESVINIAQSSCANP